jgi:micrococcal nuclease
VKRLLAALLLILAAVAANAKPRLPEFTPGEAIAIAAVRDGATLRLADGRELRLVGIEAPAEKFAAAAAARAKAALEKLVTRPPLEARYGETRIDRHGSVLAHLFAGGRWVERELVQRGLARVHGSADNRLGLALLLASEASARQARRGLWARSYYAVRSAGDAARYAGSFQIVEGTVVDTASVGGTVYLNFGPDWHTAFSLRIAPPALKLCRAAGIDPLALKGKSVRVRGFIDGRNRPLIEVSFPEQIELL